MKKSAFRKELEKAKEWAIANLEGKKIVHKQSGIVIKFNVVGLKHAIYAKTYPLKVEILYRLPELLQKSTHYSSDPEKKGNRKIIAVHRFVADWKFKKKEYFVYFIVKETSEGNFYYDHGIIKEKS